MASEEAGARGELVKKRKAKKVPDGYGFRADTAEQAVVLAATMGIQPTLTPLRDYDQLLSVALLAKANLDALVHFLYTHQAMNSHHQQIMSMGPTIEPRKRGRR